MVGQRAIQLRVVRPVLRGAPFLAAVGRQTGRPKAEGRRRKVHDNRDRGCCAAHFVAGAVVRSGEPGLAAARLGPRGGGHCAHAPRRLDGGRMAVGPAFRFPGLFSCRRRSVDFAHRRPDRARPDARRGGWGDGNARPLRHTGATEWKPDSR